MSDILLHNSGIKAICFCMLLVIVVNCHNFKVIKKEDVQHDMFYLLMIENISMRTSFFKVGNKITILVILYFYLFVRKISNISDRYFLIPLFLFIRGNLIYTDFCNNVRLKH